MWITALRRIAMGVMLVSAGLAPAAAFDRIEKGIYRIDSEHADELLSLAPGSDVNILVLVEKIPKELSDSHLSLTRKWVEAGGILWIADDGLYSALGQRVAPYKVDDYKYKKTSTGNEGGELVVKDASARLQIGNHELTEGVTQLFVFPRYKFDGTLNAVSIVEMTDTRGKHGVILAAIPIGKGFLILDGTAREEHYLFGRVRGFDNEHPNSQKQGKEWNTYDWPMLLDNAKRMAQEALQGSAVASISLEGAN